MWLERLLETFSLAIRNLLRNKLRSFLTMLGMIIGVAAVITMLSVGAGARHEIIAKIQQLGITNIIINSIEPPDEAESGNQSSSQRNRYGITFRDAEYIEATLPTVERILRVNKIRQHVWFGSKRLETTVLGVEPEYQSMFGLKVLKGRLLTGTDSDFAAKVCVVRRGVFRQLDSVEDPIGLWLKIGAHPFQVVGVLEDEQFQSHARKALALEGRSQEVYIPYATSMRSFGTVSYVVSQGSREFTEVELDQLVVATRGSETVFGTARMLESLLTHFHDKADFEIVVPLELLRQKEEAQKVFSIVMVLIASISLIVGGIGIANIMLATITERTREIGVRRAMGARRRDILVQFLVETTAIAGIGGLLGCLFALAGTYGVVHFTNWKALVSPSYVIVSLAISCSVGVLFGIFPARRAAQMDPISALRSE